MLKSYKKSKCKCNTVGLTEAFKVQNLTFFGGSISDALSDKYDLIINASGRSVANLVKANELAKTMFPSALKASSTDTAIIEIDWTDGSVPALGVDFWQGLVNDLKKIKCKFKVACCCFGGHGRTGTMLSIFAGLFDLADDPVKFIRKRYCPCAVETYAQISYIERMTGKEVKAKINTSTFKWWEGGDFNEMY